MDHRVRTARMIAEDVLLPAAPAVDGADIVPRAHLDLLAHHGLYGVACDGKPQTLWAVTEALASGCLATAFVWAQHHGAVHALTHSGNDALRYTWLRALCDGERRAGIAISGLRPPLPSLRARRAGDGWRFDGVVPWLTGVGLIDVVLAGAVAEDGRVVWALLDAVAAPTVHLAPLTLIAANASGTVRATFDDHPVEDGRVVAIEAQAPTTADGGGRPNGSFALGVAGRACALMGPSPLDGELAQRRRALDAASDADDVTLAGARAAASDLAVRAAARLIAHSGSRAALAGGHPERLLREAAFTMVFGSRPAIRDDLLGRLGART